MTTELPDDPVDRMAAFAAHLRERGPLGELQVFGTKLAEDLEATVELARSGLQLTDAELLTAWQASETISEANDGDADCESLDEKITAEVYRRGLRGSCRWCGSPIRPTDDLPPLQRQSAWRHSGGHGAGATERTRAMWCGTPDGYQKVEPAPAEVS